MHTLPPHRWYHPDNCFSYRHPLSSLFPSFSPSRNSFLEIQYISPGYFVCKLKLWSLGPKSWLCQCVKPPSSSQSLPQCVLRQVPVWVLVNIPSGNFLLKENTRKSRPCKFTMSYELWHNMKEIQIMCRGLLCLLQGFEPWRTSVLWSCNSHII